MRNFWNRVRETEWYAVIALLLVATAVALVLWAPASLFNLAVVLVGAAIVSAIFSHRT